MAEQWLSIVEYARRYKISDMTIRRRIKTGKLQAVLQEGKYFIPMSEIEKSQQDSADGMGVMMHGQNDLYQDRGPTQRHQPFDYQQPPRSLVKGHPQPGPVNPPERMSQQPMTSYQSRIQSQNQEPILGQYQQPQARVQNTQLPRNNYSTNAGYSTDPQSMAPSISPSQNGQNGMQSRDQSIIPDSLWRPLGGAATALVDTKALLAYCEATVRKAIELERKAIDRFKSKLETLEATILAKDLEIKSLRQQIEDMQLLVKIIERRK